MFILGFDFFIRILCFFNFLSENSIVDAAGFELFIDTENILSFKKIQYNLFEKVVVDF